MVTVGLGVFMFTFVIVSLVAVLMVARRELVLTGDVTIVITTIRTRRCDGGGWTLLGTLSANQIFIPSACGGKGTCGVCTVKVLEGGGAMLPTERSHVSRGEAREGVRLSCQVKVKQDMKIEVPPEVFDVRKWTCKVRSNHNVATFIKELVLELPPGEAVPFGLAATSRSSARRARCTTRTSISKRSTAQTGSVQSLAVHFDSRGTGRSRFSMANYPEEKSVIMLNVRVASPPPRGHEGIPPGKMSSYIFSLTPGDEVVISGPFGEFFAKDTQAEMLFIGGGAGMAPMRSHVFDQFYRLRTSRKISFWYGARSCARRSTSTTSTRFRTNSHLRMAPGALGAAAGRSLDRQDRIHSPSGV